MAEHDRSKLPVWAQKELTRLESEARHARQALAQHQAAQRYAEDHYGAVSYPAGTRVDFPMDDGNDDRRETVQVYTEPGPFGRRRLTVRSRFGMLHVLPVASNTLGVEVHRG